MKESGHNRAHFCRDPKRSKMLKLIVSEAFSFNYTKNVPPTPEAIRQPNGLFGGFICFCFGFFLFPIQYAFISNQHYYCIYITSSLRNCNENEVEKQLRCIDAFATKQNVLCYR